MAQSSAVVKDNTIPMPVDNAEDSVKKPKKRGGIIKLIILIVFIIAAAAFLFLSIRFDIGGVRTKMIEAVNLLDPNYAQRVEILETLEQREAELIEREENAVQEEQRLAELEEELFLFQDELYSDQADRIPIYRRRMNEKDLADMVSISLTYAKMDPVAAAEIMSSLETVEDMAAVIYYMNESNAAAIMSEMDSSIAAEITVLLLRD